MNTISMVHCSARHLVTDLIRSSCWRAAPLPAVRILLLEALPDAETMYELCPPLDDCVFPLRAPFLFGIVLCFPVRLRQSRVPASVKRRLRENWRHAVRTSNRASSFSAATTTPVMTGNALRFLNSKLVWRRSANGLVWIVPDRQCATYHCFRVVESKLSCNFRCTLDYETA